MDYYLHYPIRCKTCNEQIACFAPQYLENIEQGGMTPQESLDALGIMNYCSRISMIAPSRVTFNMENRAAIEGFRRVETVDVADSRTGRITTYNFANCFTREVAPTGDAVIVVPTPDLAPVDAGEGVDLPTDQTNAREVLVPTVVGIPVINPNPTYPDKNLSVGMGISCSVKVLSGRTYLAR
jgi:DNA-directed RNA polymerase subunit N (RpoN/RPB10)